MCASGPNAFAATSARGALETARSSGLRILIDEIATKTYIIDVNITAKTMAFGIFFAGFFVSSANLAICSKPIYAKKISAAALKTPGTSGGSK